MRMSTWKRLPREDPFEEVGIKRADVRFRIDRITHIGAAGDPS
jgi:hypothetical protein